MSIADFCALHEGVCEVAGTAPAQVPVASDDQGLTVFALPIHGVSCAVVQSPDAAFAGHVQLACRLQPVDDDDAPQALASLLWANSHLSGPDAPRYSRDPFSGAPLLQWPCWLDELTPTEAYGRMCSMAEVALEWQRSRMPAAGVDFAGKVAHMAPTFEQVDLPLADALGTPTAAMLQSMLDANFTLAMQPGSAVLCLKAGEPVLRHWPDPDTATAESIKSQVRELNALARHWAAALLAV
jgi:hypothetical protein